MLDYSFRPAFELSDNESRIVITAKQGTRQPETRLRDLSYADDISLLSESISKAEELLHHVEQAASKVGLHLTHLKRI